MDKDTVSHPLYSTHVFPSSTQWLITPCLPLKMILTHVLRNSSNISENQDT